MGVFIRRRRSELVVAAKVGILPNLAFQRWPAAMYASKAITKLRRHGAAFTLPDYISLDGQRSATAADESFSRTLRALGSSYVDLLLLHEPPAGVYQLPDELLSWFMDMKRHGKTRSIGIAAEAHTAAQLALNSKELAEILLVSDSVDTKEANAVVGIGRELQITYGYFRSRHNDATSSIIENAFSRNTHGVVLFSSTRPEHIVELSRTAARCTEQ